MRPRTRAAGAALLAVAVTGALLPAVAANATPGGSAAVTPGGSAAVTPAGESAGHAVTLITGDKVTVSAGSRITVAPGKGRSGVTFVTSTVGGHLRVVPSDAVALLRADRLDPRLFDVTGLIGFGYDDKRRKDLPLIITGDPAAARGRAGALAGTSGTRAVPGGVALKAGKSGIGSVWQGLTGGLAARSTGISKIWLDGLRKPFLKESVPQVGAPAAWAAGLTGTGVKVAVVDTGVDATHADLAGQVVAAEDFTEAANNIDEVGHGTHVAATIGSTGAAAGGYQGVAPGVQLLSAKVCMDFGCEESAILAGMQWAVEQGAKVVNMSLGGPDTPEVDPMEAAVEQLTADFGALFVISAGNSGQDETIGSPGSADSALTVGAVDKSDDLADFSSRGPRVGDAALKPDITAPGVDIVAANSKDGILGAPGALHTTLSGTSMAAPHVAGAAAILAQQHPTWTPAQLKAALMGSARTGADIGVYAQGAGRVDVTRAITQRVLAEPASVSFGRQVWPHGDDPTIARPVTFRNTGTAAVTLDLSLVTGAPAGTFTLSAESVTVPAGGSASVTLTADTRVAGPDGYLGGHVVARAGQAQVTTPFAVDKEVESYDLTITHVDRSGQLAEDYVTFLVNNATGRVIEVSGAGATTTRRAPKGTYSVLTWVFDGTEIDSPITQLLEPTVVVDRARAVRADARAGRPITVTVPNRDAASVFAIVDTIIATDEWAVGFGILADSFATLFAGQRDPRSRNNLVTSTLTNQWFQRQPDGSTAPTAFGYHLTWAEKGRLPSGFTRRVAAGDLATVHARHGGQGVPVGEFAAFGILPGSFSAWSAGALIGLPGARTEYYTTEGGVQWEQQIFEGSFDDVLVGLTFSPSRTYRAGQQVEERRLAAVFGPGFTVGGTDAARMGDDMLLSPGMHSPAGDWTGFAIEATSRTVVERDGRVISDTAEQGAFLEGVPAADAPFKLSIEVNRGAPNTLSTKVSGTWTFRSGHVAGEVPKPLALSAVRFAPPVTADNTAPAGRLFAVPFEVQRQSGSDAAPVRTLTVEVSYDDGATWKKVPVLRVGQRGVVLLSHPSGAGFVSLRAASADTAGNTVSQTVIRAYKLV